MKNKPKLKDGKLDWSDVPPKIQQAIQYIEYRRLRHKPAKIIPCTNGVGVWENAETHETFDTYDEAVASCES